ncbi:MAG: YgiT-type zinc finger protein [Candidatus Coatesbacteria bacterium]|nr:YgiT-type zinc finger protein [Candidatus Coatesbacteria bacterium]
MRCTVCGSEMVSGRTDLPFKVGPSSIVIIKELPVQSCTRRQEFVLEDHVMEKVDKILASVDESPELEVVHFAA